jgi:hypothetical protein
MSGEYNKVFQLENTEKLAYMGNALPPPLPIDTTYYLTRESLFELVHKQMKGGNLKY